VVGGFGGNGLGSRAFALARYNPNGSLDTGFSGDGKQATDFPGNDEARGVALQGDGKIDKSSIRPLPLTSLDHRRTVRPRAATNCSVREVRGGGLRGC
jgi:hypothetical protein